MVGSREVSSIARCRVVGAVVCGPRDSQDENLTPLERWRNHNFGKQQREKKLDTSTDRKLIDSMPLDQTSSPSGVNEESMYVRRSFLLLWS